MKSGYLVRAYQAVVAGALALALVASVSSYAAGPEAPSASPTPTASPLAR